ncbi:metallophosphoesterase [Nocardia nova]|uniref:metallophosphoesterase n=1 Tax=Nocardia nova TaxID=37330 RepID=UPI001C479CEE|nr:metallophosphoesterase [Nocardia nova]MBV7703548.1 metallophosphoesterase [Nocardia nova]
MSEVWFLADPHVGHRLVSGLRGFDTPEAHDAELAERWDGRVGVEDQIWVLGDISVGGTKAQLTALEWMSRRPGVKHLVAGNHDGCHPMRSRAHHWQRIYLEVFASVQQSAVRKIDGHRVLLSHFPFHGAADGDHTAENRFEEWRLPATGDNAGRWLLHGHTHSSVRIRGRMIHVGLDAHELAPVPLEWVRRVIAGTEKESEIRWPGRFADR